VVHPHQTLGDHISKVPSLGVFHTSNNSVHATLSYIGFLKFTAVSQLRDSKLQPLSTRGVAANRLSESVPSGVLVVEGVSQESSAHSASCNTVIHPRQDAYVFFRVFHCIHLNGLV